MTTRKKGVTSILSIIVIQLFFRGVITNNQQFIWLALVNASLVIVFLREPITTRLIQDGYIHITKVKTTQKMVRTYIRHGGFLLLLLFLGWQLMKWILGAGNGLTLLGVGWISIVAGLIIRKDLTQGNIYRGTKKMGRSEWILLLSLGVSGWVIMRYRVGGPMKFLLASGLGFFLYTAGLLSIGHAFGDFIKKVSWLLFATVTGILGLGLLTISGTQWFTNYITQRDSKTEYKEHIVYVEKEDTPTTTVISGENATRSIATGLSDIEIDQEDLCPENTCPRNEQCIEKPENASCIDDEEDAWLCNEGWREEGGVCYEICGTGQCALGIGCIDRPFRSFCVETGNQGWKCESGYTQIGNTCEIITVSGDERDIDTIDDEDNSNALKTGIDNEKSVAQGLDAFLNPKPQPSLIELRQEQELTPLQKKLRDTSSE